MSSFSAITLIFGFITISFASQNIQMSGECEQLRVEMEGTDDTATKMSKLNAFLDTLGPTVQADFWAVIDAAKADVAQNLPSDEAKTAANNAISDFTSGKLFGPKDEVSSNLRSQFKSLNEPDRAAIKLMARKYGKQLKTLIMPLLPASCKVSGPGLDEGVAEIQAVDANQVNGFDNPNYLTREKRHDAFIDTLTAAYREYRRRRSVEFF